MARQTVGPPPPVARTRRRGIQTFSSLRNRDYRLLWTGNLFNNGANWLQQLTVGWLVWDLSESAFLVGTVGGFRAMPFLLIGPVAGVMADRLDRRKLLLVSQAMLATSAVVFALIVWSGRVEVWHAFAYIAISGVAHSILQPVRSALVANTVPRQDLPNAFALHAMTITSSRLVWPAIGGFLVGIFGFAVNFLVEAALYVTLAALVIPMRTPYREETTRRHESPLTELADGIKYVARDKPILQLIVMSLVPNFLLQPCLYLLPVFVGAVLGRGPEILGTLLSINGGFGFAATAVIATFGYALGKGKTSLLALIVASAGGIMLGLSQWLPLTIAAVSVMGVRDEFLQDDQYDPGAVAGAGRFARARPEHLPSGPRADAFGEFPDWRPGRVAGGPGSGDGGGAAGDGLVHILPGGFREDTEDGLAP